MPAQIDLGHAVAELANVRRQLETGVVLQLNLAALDELPAQKLDRDGSCARDRISGLRCGVNSNHTRTVQATLGHVQRFEFRERNPLRRDTSGELVSVQDEDFERRRHFLWQRPCARDRISELALLNDEGEPILK